ncbi:GNAT family N-acetyltransferase [Aliamphritea spongicola]|uniref:GNAT family N-acetyltransferase n=1 Tax=Aliamphritea spongicola TaxID=707589 RepID=UPI00196AD65C|nr:GNAT family N-acetyltransferase [Aliamphritea spongicola]MBN3563306.1 GNAT family N-acetyltransferase [Aliamphritea spongicola]
MTITTRMLQPEDRQQWEQLYRGYAEFYGMSMAHETLDQVWQWIFGEEQQFFCLVAVNAEQTLTGLMHYRAMQSPLRGGWVGFLDDLFVTPDARGNGSVDALFRALEQSAADHGWPFVRWITAEDNYRGQAAYDKIADRTRWVTYQMQTG